MDRILAQDLMDGSVQQVAEAAFFCPPNNPCGVQTAKQWLKLGKEAAICETRNRRQWMGPGIQIMALMAGLAKENGTPVLIPS